MRISLTCCALLLGGLSSACAESNGADRFNGSSGGALGSGGAASGGSSAGIGGASGGATGGGSSAGGASGDSTGGSSGSPAHVVGDCSDLGDINEWQNVTPAALESDKWCVPGASDCGPDDVGTYGTIAFALDPNNSGTVFLGTSGHGIWKTTDCGSSWEKANTGSEAQAIDGGRNWSLLIDPNDSQTLYTVTGYGGPGFYKSTNGGVDWKQMFPQAWMSTFPAQGIEKLSMDPTNSLHITASFHNPCPISPAACLAETIDGGETFSITKSAETWNEGNGQTMVNEKTWFFSNGGGVIYRTTDGGQNWATVFNGFAVGKYNASGCIYTATDGSYYTGGSRGMLRSTDGISWQEMPGAPAIGGPNGGCSLVDDGTTMYASMGLIAYSPGSSDWFWKASLDDLTSFSGMNNPSVITGAGWVDYEADHGLIYTSNSSGGFYRVRVK